MTDYAMTETETKMMRRAAAHDRGPERPGFAYAYGDDETEAAETLEDAGFFARHYYRMTGDTVFRMTHAGRAMAEAMP